MAGGSFGGGTGVFNDPYLIEDIADFEAISNDLTGFYKLVNDLDFGGNSYGSNTIISQDFYGVIDGNNHRIHNFYRLSSVGSTGFFGGLYGQIKNLTIENCKYKTTGYAEDFIGLLAIKVFGDTILENVVFVNCTLELDYSYKCGFVAGNAFVHSDITLDVHVIDCTIDFSSDDRSHSLGALFGTVDNTSSYFINFEKCLVDNLTLIGASYRSERFGGFVGVVTGGNVKLSQCCIINSDFTMGGRTGSFIGVLDNTVGNVELNNCFSMANISNPAGLASNDFICGLIGDIPTSTNIKIINCHYAGSMSANGSTPYGLTPSGVAIATCTSSYFDSTKSSTNETGCGIPYPTAMMLTQGIYLGWDFTNIWDIDASGVVNNGYPFLRCVSIFYGIEIRITTIHNVEVTGLPVTVTAIVNLTTPTLTAQQVENYIKLNWS